MKVYRRVKVAVALLAVTYAAIGVSRQALGYPELFPISSWALFCNVPTVQSDFGVKILEFNGKALRPAPYYEQTAEVRDRHSVTAYLVIQRLGKNLANGNDKASKRYQRLFEGAHLPKECSIRYEVVRRTYDPLQRWRDQQFAQVELVERLEKRVRR